MPSGGVHPHHPLRSSGQRLAMGKSRRPRGFWLSEGDHRLRMEAVKRANELPSKYLEAMQSASLFASKIEIESSPISVPVSRILRENIKVRFPFCAPVFPSKRLWKRPIEGVSVRDTEEPDGGIVDQVRELLHLVVQQAIAKLQVQLALDRCDTRQFAKDDLRHPL